MHSSSKKVVLLIIAWAVAIVPLSIFSFYRQYIQPALNPTSDVGSWFAIFLVLAQALIFVPLEGWIAYNAKLANMKITKIVYLVFCVIHATTVVFAIFSFIILGI